MTPNVYTEVQENGISPTAMTPIRRTRINVPISGLVLTFRSPIRDHAGDLAALRSIPEVEVGQAAESKLAIVVDSTSACRDQEIWSQLWQLPNVVDELVCADDTNRIEYIMVHMPSLAHSATTNLTSEVLRPKGGRFR